MKKILYIFHPLLFGFIIGLFLNTDIYPLLNKPPLSPNTILFPIIWSILYLIMGISFYIISYDNSRKKAQFLFYSQLFVNLVWPILFFNLNLYLFSNIWILLLIILVINMILEFMKIKKAAGLLNIPYLIWLLFAFYLNIGVYLLN